MQAAIVATSTSHNRKGFAPPARVDVINDINGERVRLYRVVQNHLEEFVRQFKYALSSREVFKWHQAAPPDTLTDIQRAVLLE